MFRKWAGPKGRRKEEKAEYNRPGLVGSPMIWEAMKSLQRVGSRKVF